MRFLTATVQSDLAQLVPFLLLAVSLSGFLSLNIFSTSAQNKRSDRRPKMDLMKRRKLKGRWELARRGRGCSKNTAKGSDVDGETRVMKRKAWIGTGSGEETERLLLKHKACLVLFGQTLWTDVTNPLAKTPQSGATVQRRKTNFQCGNTVWQGKQGVNRINKYTSPCKCVL